MTPREIGMWAQLGAVITGRTFWECADALAAGAGTAETNEDLAQSEGRQSGGVAVTPNPSSPSHIPLMNKDSSRADR